MPSLPDPSMLSPQNVLDRVRRDVERNTLRARNGIRLAAGTDRPAIGHTPKDVVWRSGRTELWHYRNDDVRLYPQGDRPADRSRWSGDEVDAHGVRCGSRCSTTSDSTAPSAVAVR